MKTDKFDLPTLVAALRAELPRIFQRDGLAQAAAAADPQAPTPRIRRRQSQRDRRDGRCGHVPKTNQAH